MHDPAVLQPAIRQLARSRVLNKRKRTVPAFDDIDAWLDGIRALRVGDGLSFGGFEKEIPAWSSQATTFGPSAVDPLLALLTEPVWEPGVVALWALNSLARATSDPSPYLQGLEAWSRWSEAHNGWARGELTAALDEARAEHLEALRGTHFEGKAFLTVVRALA